MEEGPVLINNMLFNEDIPDINYSYCRKPLTVGITNVYGNKRRYLVYEVNDFYCTVDEKVFDIFEEAILAARQMYTNMLEKQESKKLIKK